jgi:hypothetical protein
MDRIEKRVITSEQHYHVQETYCECCGNLDQPEHTQTERYYQLTFDEFPSVNISDGIIYFAGRSICDQHDLLDQQIPTKYMVRSKRSGDDYWWLAFGLDLVADGRIWIGGSYQHKTNSQFFNSFTDLFKFLKDLLGDNWIITIEEDFRE